VSYASDLASAGLGTAWLKNEAGNFVLPTKEAVEAAAAELDARTPPDERLTIGLAPGTDTYPIVNYEYAIVSAKQANTTTAAAEFWQLLRATASIGAFYAADGCQRNAKSPCC
jgi:phosphate transport system substrate-binding protein